MRVIHENNYYSLQILNNKYYRYDKILKTSMLLNRFCFIQMLQNIKLEKNQTLVLNNTVDPAAIMTWTVHFYYHDPVKKP